MFNIWKNTAEWGVIYPIRDPILLYGVFYKRKNTAERGPQPPLGVFFHQAVRPDVAPKEQGFHNNVAPRGGECVVIV